MPYVLLARPTTALRPNSRGAERARADVEAVLELEQRGAAAEILGAAQPQRLPDRLPLLNLTRLDALLPFAFCALCTHAMPASAIPYSVTLLCACAGGVERGRQCEQCE